MSQSLIEFAPNPFSGPNVNLLPKVPRIDPIESAGSLMLADATHPLGGWGSGLPANQSFIPNLFEANAQALAGPSMWASKRHDAIFTRGSTLPNGQGLVERTAKGGIHVVVSPTVPQDNVNGRINMSAPTLKSYIKTNKTHNFYVSVWVRLTAPSTAPSGNGVVRIGISANGTWGLWSSHYNNVVGGTAGGTKLGDRPLTEGGPRFGVHNVAGTVIPTFDTDTDSEGVSNGWGNSNLWTFAHRQAAHMGKQGGSILYRAYVEDLTVSGRTYAEVTALDVALFEREHNTPGGRFHNDTFTDASTIA